MAIYDSDLNRDIEVESEGLLVIRSDDFTLQIDIDNKDGMAMFERNKWLLEFLGVVNTIIEPSKSGLPKRHITIKMSQSVDLFKRILLQLLLGSDSKREVLNTLRAIKGIEPNVVFFERKEK